VAKAFADSAWVNQVLRLLLQLGRTNIASEIDPGQAMQPTSHAHRRAKEPKPVPLARG
jgi:hypothetical protein